MADVRSQLRAERRARGTCPECGGPPEPGAPTCAAHRPYYIRAAGPGPRLYTAGQIAGMLGVDPRTVAKWVDSGRLGGFRLPGSLDRRVHRDSLVAFVRDHGLPVPPELAAGALVAHGIARDDLPRARHCDAFDLGVTCATGPVACAVPGDADGTAAMYRAAELVRARSPHAALVLVVGEDVAEPDPARWAAVLRRPVDRAALALAVARHAPAAEPEGAR